MYNHTKIFAARVIRCDGLFVQDMLCTIAVPVLQFCARFVVLKLAVGFASF
jgi:hypothetical protein